MGFAFRSTHLIKLCQALPGCRHFAKPLIFESGRLFFMPAVLPAHVAQFNAGCKPQKLI
jgi:hypothetical protein